MKNEKEMNGNNVEVTIHVLALPLFTSMPSFTPCALSVDDVLLDCKNPK